MIATSTIVLYSFNRSTLHVRGIIMRRVFSLQQFQEGNDVGVNVQRSTAAASVHDLCRHALLR